MRRFRISTHAPRYLARVTCRSRTLEGSSVGARRITLPTHSRTLRCLLGPTESDDSPDAGTRSALRSARIWGSASDSARKVRQRKRWLHGPRWGSGDSDFGMVEHGVAPPAAFDPPSRLSSVEEVSIKRAPGAPGSYPLAFPARLDTRMRRRSSRDEPQGGMDANRSASQSVSSGS